MPQLITGSTLTLGALIGLIAAVLGSLLARPALQALGTQQDKMKTCNATAGTQDLKGDARKAFVSDYRPCSR